MSKEMNPASVAIMRRAWTQVPAPEADRDTVVRAIRRNLQQAQEYNAAMERAMQIDPRVIHTPMVI